MVDAESRALCRSDTELPALASLSSPDGAPGCGVAISLALLLSRCPFAKLYSTKASCAGDIVYPTSLLQEASDIAGVVARESHSEYW